MLRKDSAGEASSIAVASSATVAATEAESPGISVALLGVSPWILGAVVAAIGLAGVTSLAWLGAGLVAGLSLSGSI